MEMKNVVQQMIKLNQTLFNNAYDLSLQFQDQAEKLGLTLTRSWIRLGYRQPNTENPMRSGFRHARPVVPVLRHMLMKDIGMPRRP